MPHLAPSNLDAANASPKSLVEWVLGPNPQQHPRLQRMLLGVMVYVAFAVLRILGALGGWMDPLHVAIQVSGDLLGTSLFYLAVRSGWSARFHDPLMTLAQIIFALTSVVMSYGLFEVGRGAALQLLCLILVFGMLQLKPSQILILGGLAVAMLVLMLALMNHWQTPGFDLRQEAMNIGLASVFLPMLALVAKQVSELRLKQIRQSAELSQTLARLKELATRDSLTGLTNRRHMLTLMEEECKRQDRGGRRFCLALLDIDWFKKINDGFGHPTGDEVLKQLATLAPEALRTSDVIARWGGEEFLILMPSTDLEGATLGLERLRAHLSPRWGFEAGPAWRAVTFSAGVTTYRLGESLSVTLERADKALYMAKTHGRDQVWSA
jgi:diguanylate cyclase (GGDEF)-like protein